MFKQYFSVHSEAAYSSLGRHNSPQIDHNGLDLETSGLDPNTNAIHQVCCVFWDSDKPLAPDNRSVVICSQPTTTAKETNILQADNERDLLLKFKEVIRKHDPDIFVGYYTNSFDQKFLQYRLQMFGLTESYQDLGRGDKAVFKEQMLQSSALGANAQTLWMIPGRTTMDLFLYCKINFPTLENFKLNTAAKKFVGDEKVSLFCTRHCLITNHQTLLFPCAIAG